LYLKLVRISASTVGIMQSNPYIWAHRGASGFAPENTLAAFSLAEQLGADGIELDVHLSRDGVPVVMHDDMVDRTTDSCGAIANFSLSTLQSMDAG
jgi:glycerophosphoryl diester phosphodiesterase